MSTDMRPWVDNMTLTGRRQATSVAASRLRQWVNGTHEGRPSRGELKAWVLLVLDERRGLHNRVEALTKETDAVDDQRDTLVEALAEMKVERDALGAQRDDALEEAETFRIGRDELQELYARGVKQWAGALEGYREDVERFHAHVETLDADRTRRTKERGEALRVHARLNETITHVVKAYEEMRTAWELAEAELREERNELAHRVGVGRASCSHTSRGGAE